MSLKVLATLKIMSLTQLAAKEKSIVTNVSFLYFSTSYYLFH